MAGMPPTPTEQNINDVQAAKEVAKATHTTYGSDPVDAIVKKYDKNGDGAFQLEEVRAIVRDVMSANQEKHLYRNALSVAIAIIVLLIGAMLGVSVAAGEMVKESHVSSNGMMTNLDGDVVQVGVAEMDYALFDLPSKSIVELSQLKRMSLFIDVTGNATLGNAVVESSFQLASVILTGPTKATFTVTSGERITIDGDARTGTIVIDGASYPVGDGTTDVKPPTAARRLFGRRASFLTTQGSFVLSSGTANALGTDGR